MFIYSWTCLLRYVYMCVYLFGSMRIFGLNVLVSLFAGIVLNWAGNALLLSQKALLSSWKVLLSLRNALLLAGNALLSVRNALLCMWPG